MIDGRPADKHFASYFFKNGVSRYIDQYSYKTDVSRLPLCSLKLEKALWHGKGKIWLTDGRVFIGDFHQDKLKQGKLYEIQEDNTYTLF